MDKGAHFYRCDFQVHTPRDQNWKGTRPTTEAERVEFARAFVAACRTKGLAAVAITDHHDFVLLPFIRQAAAEECDAQGETLPAQDRLVVYPGLELTLGIPCQALLILDAGFPSDRFSDVLKALRIDPVDSAKASIGSVETLDHLDSLEKVCDELDGRDWIKSRYILLPHVSDGGHQTLIRKGMQAKYKSMPCVGAYVDGDFSSLGDGARTIVEGRDPNWGSKFVAVFQTSDSRSEDFASLGKHSTWVKWASPTAEALRQACLAPASRISHERPELPSICISRLSVSNSLFLGRIDLELNPQYTAIIGGRGTGKSSLLDYLRWTLCDQPVSVPIEEESADPIAKQRKLVAGTLAPVEATVEVHFTINSIPHIARRSAKTGELTLKVGNAEFTKSSDAEIRDLLPIHAYSQKQLSNVAVRIEELTRFVTAPIQPELAEIDHRVTELDGKIRENYASLQRKRGLTASTHRLEMLIRSLTEQAGNLRQSMENLSEEDTKVLEYKPSYDAAEGQVETWLGLLERGLDESERLASSLDSVVAEIGTPTELDAPVGAAIADAAAKVEEALRSASRAIETAAEGLRVTLTEASEFGQLSKSIRDSIASFDQKYQTVKERSTAHATKLAELSTVEEQQRTASQSIRTQRAELQALGDPEEAHGTLIHDRFDLLEKRSERIGKQCEDLATLSGGLIRAKLLRGRDLAAVAERLRGATAGSNLRGTKIEGLFEQLSTESNPLATWELALTELEQLAVIEDMEVEITREMCPTLAGLGLAPADLKRVASKLTPEGWLNVALTPISDHPSFEYQTKEDTYIEFSSASPGQQATALLKVLLAQSGPPLIIDQPEDDLDSQMIQDIVESIWEAKRRRQLVFTSHNANLVVNGDAELVVYCDYRVQGEQSAGELKEQGAIDVPKVREAITRVMEGGEKAFKLRKEKYGF